MFFSSLIPFLIIMVLIIKHIAIEGPGTIAEFFDQQKIDYRIVELSQGERLPGNLKNIDGVIVLGGPMNVYEEAQHPFLKEEDVFIRNVLKAGLPYLGICLGSQLLAKSSNASVKKARQKEIGWALIQQTDEGKTDPLFAGLDDQLIAFQWHEDTFDIPPRGRLLSTSQIVPHQAFKIGPHAYGLQYHIEVDKDTIASWIEEYFKVSKAQDSKEGRKMLDQFEQLKTQYFKQANHIYQNFVNIVETAGQAKAGV